MKITYLGIDIAKAKFDAALLVGEKFKTKVFANTPKGFAALSQWLKRQQVVRLHACLEATGSYGDALAEFLADSGHTVSVVNPAQIKAFGRSLLTRNKTDAVDARLIARFCARNQPPAWQPLPLEIRTLQALVRRLAALQAMRQQEQNRLDTAHAVLKEPIQAHLDFLSSEIKALQDQIRQHIDQHPKLRGRRDLLETIPGVGEATIATVLAFFVIDRFKNAKQLAAFLGLSPRRHDSGSSVRGRTHISKTGDASLRAALYMPAVVARTHNPVIRAFCLRLEQTGKTKLAAIVAAMRKLVHIIFGVLKSATPFNPELAKA
ncbi:MAG TPA: IS110 family transposase [Gammaproteobacteria bacterium]|nr:IS110 family transposase [Gammaproteobacteria bacterium]